MNAAVDTRAPAPIVQSDPFTREFMDDPYPGFAAMRAAGPVLWSPQYGCYIVARHDDVQRVLSEWQTFSSAAGVGLANFSKEKPWRPPSIVLEADPPLHTRTRTVLARTMTPGVVKALRERFEREAEILVDRVLDMGAFDGITDFAEHYPVKVFPDALGLPEKGRENLLPYGSMVFNSFGPRNEFTEAAMANADSVRGWIMANCTRKALGKDGLGAMIYAAVDSGELTEDEAGMLVRSFLSAGVDTTCNAFGNLLWCLATHPDQWRKLREKPELARNAFEESLRYEGPAQAFFRTTTKDVEIGGIRIAANEKICAFMQSANRDPQRWERADAFDIERRVVGHMGFGTGIHGCVGQPIARLEGEAVFAALARKAKTIELAGEPKRQYNNVLRSFASLPVRVTRA
ncbi:MAG: cytochrome P450 [Hyphomicrobiales bacterium]|nr:cytochrome P450 [Hyphomicrobiales bacterium]